MPRGQDARRPEWAGAEKRSARAPVSCGTSESTERAGDTLQVDVTTRHSEERPEHGRFECDHDVSVLLRPPGGHALAIPELGNAWSSSGAPHRGGGLPPSEPELVAESHDRPMKLTACARLVKRARSSASAGCVVKRFTRSRWQRAAFGDRIDARFPGCRRRERTSVTSPRFDRPAYRRIA